MIINHNMNAINANRMMASNTVKSGKSMEKLSSGLRINRAGDDAAGLAISEKMRSQIRGLDQASRNSQDAISLVQTAEGALNETQSILQRMRELSVQASNDTNTLEDREQIQQEVNQLSSEINRIGNTTEFNTKKVLNGDFEFSKATATTATGSVALNGTTKITNTDTSGSVKGGDFGVAGVRNPKESAASATGTVNTGAIAIAAGTNNELTIKIDGTQHNIAFADAVAGTAALTEINTKLNAVGATASVDGGGKLTITSDTLGNGGSIEILGGGFATSFMDADVSNITHTEGKDVNDVWVHGDVGAEVTGSVDISNGAGGLNGTNIVVDGAGGMNELTLEVDGVEKTITLGDKTYDGTAGKDQAQLITDLQAALDAGFGAGKVTASVDSGNKLVLTSADTTVASDVEVKGGGLADKLFGAEATRVTQERQAANNTLTFDLDGTSTTVNVADKVYQDLADFVDTNKAAFAAKGVTISDEAGKLQLTSNTTGASSSITNLTDSDLTKQLGLVKTDGSALDAGNSVQGANGNTTLSITVDGETVDAVIQEGDYTDKNVLASAVESAINNATTTADDVSVTVTDDGKLEITSGKTGSTSDVVIGSHANKDAAGILGLTTNTKVAGEDQKNAELTFQIGANKNQSMGLQIKDMRAASLGIVGTGSDFTSTATVTDGTNNTAVENALDVTDSSKAAKAIEVLDKAIESVSKERAKLGSTQNRLEHTINNLNTSSENLTAAESRIRDVDMAKEMMEFSKNNILNQAAQAMLAQAKQAPQGVLQLLR